MSEHVFFNCMYQCLNADTIYRKAFRITADQVPECTFEDGVEFIEILPPDSKFDQFEKQFSIQKGIDCIVISCIATSDEISLSTHRMLIEKARIRQLQKILWVISKRKE